MVPDFVERKILSVKVRTGRRIFRNSTNAPYLSGDGFADLCDVSFRSSSKKNKLPTFEEMRAATSIFCPSDKLEEMLNIYENNINARVIVAGNSDRDFYSFEAELPTSINRLYIQNSHISNDKYRTLPIGIENKRYGRNGYKKFFDSKHVGINKKDAILVGPFSPTHPERVELDDWFKINDQRIFSIGEYLSTKKLSLVSAGFRYVACPRGNGTDTHRFWETLYRGSIPVVKQNDWSKSIAALGIPVIELERWSFEEFIWKKTEKEWKFTNPAELSILWLDHWKREFETIS
jgi:hypothetical protein